MVARPPLIPDTSELRFQCLGFDRALVELRERQTGRAAFTMNPPSIYQWMVENDQDLLADNRRRRKRLSDCLSAAICARKAPGTATVFLTPSPPYSPHPPTEPQRAMREADRTRLS